MTRLLAAALALPLFSAPLLAAPVQTAPAAAKPAKASPAGDAFKNDDQRSSYAYGYSIGQKLSALGLNDAETRLLAQGLRDAAAGKEASVSMPIYLPKFGDLAQQRMGAKAGAEKKKGQAFAEKFVKDENPHEIKGGGYIKILTEGAGASPSPEDTVKVHYAGTLINGTEFDSSYKRGEPATFPLNRVIPCWTNGVAMMKVGGKAKLVCPSDAAYGDSGRPGIPGGATLIFQVELLDIVKAESAPAAPEAKPAAPKK